ncbi:hypothetical protein niasHS_006210 [Heterodera schachtii]|uniref:Uncharacterized protein n=1 Tax=Heterodera schachtii TaxID=97005 RepID=A0ABD2JSE8_HETSC
MLFCTTTEEKKRFGQKVQLDIKGDGYCNVAREGVACQAECRGRHHAERTGKCDGMEKNNKKSKEIDGPLNGGKMGENRSSSSSSINSNLIDPINIKFNDPSDADDQQMLSLMNGQLTC